MEISLIDSIPQLLQSSTHLFPLFLTTAFIFFIVTTCFYKRSSSRFPQMKLPPGPKPLPVLGNIHQLAGPPLHVALHDLAKTYGPICHLKLGQASLVSVTSSEVANEILKTQELKFAQRKKSPIFETTSFDRGSLAFSPYGEYWRQIKKLFVSELLSPTRVRHFRSLREQEVFNLIESVKSTSGLPFNVSNMVFACANSIISKASVGQKHKRQDEFLLAVKEQLKLASHFSLLLFFPSLRFLNRLNGNKAKFSLFREVYDDILRTIIADHRITAKSHERSSPCEENLVDVLLRLQESAQTGISLTDNTIKDIVLDMLGGGTDTSGAALEWAFSEMLKNPGIMKKAQTELRDSLKGKAIVEEADLENIQYLRLIIKETLRLHPPSPVFHRASLEACVVHGYDLPKDSKVLINTWSLGRDPKRWENPEKFEPERFLDSSIDLVGTHFEFLPFGSGRRMCPGAGFAVASLELILANLMYYFDWKLANGLTPDELDMIEAPSLVVKRLNPLIVVATPHHKTA